MAMPAAPTTTPAPPVPAAPERAPAEQAPSPELGNAAFGLLADGGFVARLGAGMRLSAADLGAAEGADLSALPQPVPGLRLTRAKWVARRSRLEVDASLAVPHVEAADIKVSVDREGKPSVSGRLAKTLQVPALGNPRLSLSMSEDGVLGGSATVAPANLAPHGLRSLTVTGGGELALQNGRMSGKVDATLAYAKLGSGELHLAFDEAGRVTGTGNLKVAPPFLSEARLDLALDQGGNLGGTLTAAMTEAASPIPALSLTAGTLTVTYVNGAVSGSLADFRAAYRGLADVTASASIANGAFSGEGSLALTVPGLDEASGSIRVRNGVVSGSLALDAKAFPDALPVKSGRITATLAESGRVAFDGTVAVALGPAGNGQLTASYSEAGQLAISATMTLAVPGLQGAQVQVSYVEGDISGEAQVPVDPSLLPGVTGNVAVRYRQGLWSGDTELAYAADDGKLSGRIRIAVAQTGEGALQVGGSGEVEAQIAPRLRGMLTATILPEGGVDVSGRITVTEPLELFPEKTFDKELFKYSQDIPLWAILVAVIRVRAGLRGGIGAGVFRNIVVEGSYTLGSAAADPTFSISGEMFIPAYLEAYVAFGAGLGLDVVLGELTGGIEGVATAGLYGAVSVVPELSYADGDWGIEGVATLAAGAKLKIGLNAWAEVEAFWVTVWEEKWKLGEWVWDVGPELGLQAKMAYKFGQPGPPEVEFNSSDIDTSSMIQAAMPEDGPAPSGAQEALQNKAEWKGALKESKPAPVPPDLAAQSSQAPPAPQPAQQPKPKSGKPAPGSPATTPQPGQTPGQAAAAAAAPPGSPAAASAAAAAAQPDTGAKGTVPPSEVPTAKKPRYEGPITLATVDEPPAPMPRTAEQQNEDVTAAQKALDLAVAASPDSDTLDDWFPRIKNRFRLAHLGYAGDFDTGFRIEGGVNPQIKVTGLHVVPKGLGVLGDKPGAKHITEIKHESGAIQSTSVGIGMTADPLGPDHPLGSEAGGQDALMKMLPTDPALYPATTDRFIRGHLLNYDLGGLGKDYNLYPITAQANAEHFRLVEKSVKAWVNQDKYWTRYTVKVRSSGKLVPLKTGTLHAIESVVDTKAELLDLSLKPVKTEIGHIVSRFDAAMLKKGADSGLDATETVSDSTSTTNDAAGLAGLQARAIDLATTPQTAGGGASPVFGALMYDDLLRAHRKYGRAKTAERLMSNTGFGERSREVLYTAYDDVKGKEDKTIHALKTDDLPVFARVANGWTQYRNAIA